MKRWEDKLKQYEEQNEPEFWKENKVTIIFILLLLVLSTVAFLII